MPTNSPWRSALYPADWTPSFTDSEGRFLHDVSYAGWHGDGAHPEAPADAKVFDVVASYGADPKGASDATAAAQQAIDDASAAGGGVVFFPEGLYRVDGQLVVAASKVVLRGAGPSKTKLWLTKTAGMSFAAHVHLGAAQSTDLEIPLAKDSVSRSAELAVDDAKDLAAGDDVDVGFVITDAFVAEHGMTGTWSAFNGSWQPFFHRTVVAVDKASSPHRVTLDVPLRYPAKTSNQASLRRVKGTLSEVGVEHLGVANATDWATAWTMNQTHAIELVGVRDAWIRDVASFPSPGAPTMGQGAGAHLASSGVMVLLGKRVTIEDTHLGFAQDRGGGGNGYLFELRQSSEVLVRDSTADSGRHNFIQNWGFGTTGCVLLRVESRNGSAMVDMAGTLETTGYSETHHSLATANLVDSSRFDDGFSIVNRRLESTGAGHTGTENTIWNVRGKGRVRSMQYKHGYVIGTEGVTVERTSILGAAEGTEPIDWSEGEGLGATLDPPSLYEDMRARRLGKAK